MCLYVCIEIDEREREKILYSHESNRHCFRMVFSVQSRLFGTQSNHFRNVRSSLPSTTAGFAHLPFVLDVLQHPCSAASNLRLGLAFCSTAAEVQKGRFPKQELGAFFFVNLSCFSCASSGRGWCQKSAYGADSR